MDISCKNKFGEFPYKFPPLCCVRFGPATSCLISISSLSYLRFTRAALICMSSFSLTGNKQFDPLIND
jgi:hypothetical protein